MSNTDSGFAKFVPGFEFLQSLTKGASGGLPQMPGLANWVAPTLNVEELDKRIDELKAVHFWLDQNSKALSATIQALEVQKLTLATLKGMNFDLSEVANALKMKPIAPLTPSAPVAPVERPAAAAQEEAQEPEATEAPSPKAARSGGAAKSAKAKPADGVAGLVDPMQLWGALTQQFQQIAATAMKDVGKGNPMAAAQAATQPTKATPSAAKATRAKPATKRATSKAKPKG
jgi:chaperonin GroEL (HSP60 family)